MFAQAFMFLVLASASLADVSHILPGYTAPDSEILPPPPPRPYNFQYSAGRYPGHVDRVQQESGDGSGTVRGSYSFVDPKQKIRTVEYVADENGFHPHLVNYEDTQALPKDTEAVKLEKSRQEFLYKRIAEAHARGSPAIVPQDTKSVAQAKHKHFELFEKIAAEHAAIETQRQAERLAYEATSVQSVEDPSHEQSYVIN